MIFSPHFLSVPKSFTNFTNKYRLFFKKDIFWTTLLEKIGTFYGDIFILENNIRNNLRKTKNAINFHGIGVSRIDLHYSFGLFIIFWQNCGLEQGFK